MIHNLPLGIGFTLDKTGFPSSVVHLIPSRFFSLISILDGIILCEHCSTTIKLAKSNSKLYSPPDGNFADTLS